MSSLSEHLRARLCLPASVQRDTGRWPALLCRMALVLLASACVAPKPAASAPASASVPSLAALTQACKALPTQGIGCATNYNGDVWLMLAHFETRDDVEKYAQPVSQNLGVAFCQATRAGRQPAKFVIELHGQGQQQLDCQRGTWTPWLTPAPLPELAANGPDAGCRALANAPDVPLNCSITHANSMTTMTVSVQSQHDFDYYWTKVASDLVVPYCNALNARGIGGFVRVVAATEKQARVLKCDTATLGEWFSVQQATPARPTQQPPSQRSAPPARVNQSTAL